MSGKITMLSRDDPNDPALSKAMCEGRRAAVAGAAASTNPHVAGSPANEAWGRGWASYSSAGTFTFQDCCADKGKIAARTLTATEQTSDVTGATYRFEVTPATECEIDYGDGERGYLNAGLWTDHIYEATGAYTAVAWLGQLKLDDVVVAVTIVEP
jgi:hypothetical protein